MFILYDDTQKVPIKIYRKSLNDVEDTCIEQAINMSKHPSVFKQVALMPDCHAGYGVCIGGVFALDGAVCPNAVGVDIGCGMAFIQTDILAEDVSKETLKQVIAQIKRDIPMGKSHHTEAIALNLSDDAEALIAEFDMDIKVKEVASQLSTLGGGNHFIELQVDKDGFLCVMLHSGSRNIGYKIAKKHNEIAKKLNKKWHSDLDEKADLAFLPIGTDEAKEYINDMNFALGFAKLNRAMMLNTIKYAINIHIGEFNVQFESDVHHNYASLENHFGKNVWVHRKGATSAMENQIGIIPGSMGTSSYIVIGKGNANSFNSCSHGAGRVMSRTQAKQTFTLDEFKSKMDGIVSLDVNAKHLDESPMAYKDIDEVIELQSDLIKVHNILKPIANIKG